MPNAKVLLVDDDQELCCALAQVLAMYNFEATTASTLPNALNRIGSEKFDAVLLNLNMPGTADHLTMVQALRQANPKAVMLVFSASPEAGDISSARRLQADEILVKPIPVSELINVITQRLIVGPAAAPTRTAIA